MFPISGFGNGCYRKPFKPNFHSVDFEQYVARSLLKEPTKKEKKKIVFLMNLRKPILPILHKAKTPDRTPNKKSIIFLCLRQSVF